MPLRICSEPRCGSVVHYRGRCRDHAKRRNAETRSQNRGVYNSKRWQITRSRYLSEHPLCECGCGGIAEDVHHKQDIQAGGDPWAWDNLEALTHACHARVTRRQQLA
jgi:5-methylcytosine-specific restriction endonuclease McrA